LRVNFEIRVLVLEQSPTEKRVELGLSGFFLLGEVGERVEFGFGRGGGGIGRLGNVVHNLKDTEERAIQVAARRGG
jgi:hypothetical protein